MYNLLTNICM